MSFFNTDFVVTSTVMSFLNFRDQARLATVSRAASTLASSDANHNVIREFASMHTIELNQFYKNNVLKYNKIQSVPKAKEIRLLVSQAFYFQRVLEKHRRTHFNRFKIMASAYFLNAINATKKSALDNKHFAISLLDSFPLITRFSIDEDFDLDAMDDNGDIDEDDMPQCNLLVKKYKNNQNWKIPEVLLRDADDVTHMSSIHIIQFMMQLKPIQVKTTGAFHFDLLNKTFWRE